MSRDDRPMLVRFLSFCATVLGTARYKAVFISCLTLVVSLSGVTAVALVKGNNGGNDASATIQEEENTDREEGFAPHLGGNARNQNPKQPVEQPKSNESSATQDSIANRPAETAPKTPAVATEIVLNAAEVRLSGEEVKLVTVNTSDESKVTWSVAILEQTSNLQLVMPIELQEKSLSFQVKSNANTEPGTYNLIITAKDTARNLTITKQFTVIVQ